MTPFTLGCLRSWQQITRFFQPIGGDYSIESPQDLAIDIIIAAFHRG